MRQSITDHEEFCRLHFDAWLERSSARPARLWEKGSDPPDFFLVMNGVRYAVEVSRITDQGRNTASDSLYRLVDELEIQLLANDAISGTYIVDLEEPLPRGSRHRRELRDRIEAFVKNTKSESRPLPERVEIAARLIARVEKRLPSGANLFCNGISGGGWENEIRAEYEKIAIDLLRRKKDGLKAHGPSILILQDELCPISPGILREVLRAIPEASAFEAIYAIRAQAAGEIIVSRPAWPIGNQDGNNAQKVGA